MYGLYKAKLNVIFRILSVQRLLFFRKSTLNVLYALDDRLKEPILKLVLYIV
jgi:hypothetical protein